MENSFIRIDILAMIGSDTHLENIRFQNNYLNCNIFHLYKHIVPLSITLSQVFH